VRLVQWRLRARWFIEQAFPQMAQMMIVIRKTDFDLQLGRVSRRGFKAAAIRVIRGLRLGDWPSGSPWKRARACVARRRLMPANTMGQADVP
jgi:hypothetical protein